MFETEIPGLQLARRWQYAVYFLVSCVALLFVVILLPSSGPYFHRFFREINPIIVVAAASLVGVVVLWLLQSRYHLALLKGKETIQGMALSAAFATLLALAILIADLLIRYPQDTNVPVPQAFLFYPAIGFVVEIIFHVLPFGLLLLALNPLAGWLGKERVFGLVYCSSLSLSQPSRCCLKERLSRGAQPIRGSTSLRLLFFSCMCSAALTLFRCTHFVCFTMPTGTSYGARCAWEYYSKNGNPAASPPEQALTFLSGLKIRDAPGFPSIINHRPRQDNQPVAASTVIHHGGDYILRY